MAIRALPLLLSAPLVANEHADTQRIGIGISLAWMTAAMAIDAAALGREEVVEAPKVQNEKPGLGVSPTIDAANRGGGLSLVGTF